MTDHPSPDLVVPLRAGSGGSPLFCVHPVSGSAYAYRGLAGLLGADQPVYGFEAPGFDNDRAPVAVLPRLADEYTSILRAFAPGPGYRLHSALKPVLRVLRDHLPAAFRIRQSRPGLAGGT